MIFASIVVISVLGTLVAYLMVSPRVYYAMARDGLFFKEFRRTASAFRNAASSHIYSNRSRLYIDSFGNFRADNFILFLCRCIFYRAHRRRNFQDSQKGIFRLQNTSLSVHTNIFSGDYGNSFAVDCNAESVSKFLGCRGCFVGLARLSFGFAEKKHAGLDFPDLNLKI